MLIVLPLSESEVEGDIMDINGSEVSIKTKPLLASLPLRGQVTSHTTVHMWLYSSRQRMMPWAQLFKGRLALNPGLNLTEVSSFVQKNFL